MVCRNTSSFDPPELDVGTMHELHRNAQLDDGARALATLSRGIDPMPEKTLPAGRMELIATLALSMWMIIGVITWAIRSLVLGVQ